MAKPRSARIDAVPTIEGHPVEGFPIAFTWHTGEWERIFDRQLALVTQDVLRARAEDRVVVYLSVPISRRGGSFEATNVDIAMATERRLMDRWGEGVFVLNPARYQMESKGGYGLVEQHARAEGIDLEALMRQARPSGGDYMRMWTKLLVEDGNTDRGDRFDAIYFLGPSDVHDFFGARGEPLTRRVQAYFASKLATDAEFRYAYTGDADVDWGQRDIRTFTPGDWAPLERWEAMRKEFLRFYLLRASANSSLGAHDEWNIWVLLNRRRLALTNGDTGVFMPAYFDGKQVDPGASTILTSNGYGKVTV
jgi:hypothetical protein